MSTHTRTYNQSDFSCRHDSQEGIINKKTNKKYPTTLTAALEAESVDDLASYSTFLPHKEEVRQSFDELCADRLKSLREKYDYLELYWGGGYDSTKMLEVSTKTGIHFDSISMFCHGTPATVDSLQNYELRKNFQFIEHYTEKFPKVKLNFLELDQCYSETVAMQQDYHEWAVTGELRLMMGEMAHDLLVPERKTPRSAVVSGKGWHGYVYNSKYDIWSLYHSAIDINHGGAGSRHADVIRFYEDPRIVKKIGSDVMDYFYRHRPIYKDTWIPEDKWLQENIMYPDLKGKIVHLGEDLSFGGWQNHPKHKWYMTDEGVKTKYKEFWKWIGWLGENIDKRLLVDPNKLSFGNNIKIMPPIIIDF